MQRGPDGARRRIAWRRKLIGGHVHVDVFMGWDGYGSQNTGKLIMDPDQADDFIAALQMAAAERPEELVVEEALA